MSKVKRYFVVIGYNPEPYTEMVSDIDGDYVRYEDYAALRAELAEKETLLIHHEQYEEALEVKLSNTEAENSKLREQNKVLREEENVPYLRELKENSELRNRLKPVCIEIKTCETCEHDYYKSLYCSPCQVCKGSDMWQAIKAACKKGE